MSDPLEPRRARVDAAALLDLLAAEERGDEPSGVPARLARQLAARGWRPPRTIAKETFEAIREWWRRGWHPSIEYFLWSRHRRFLDSEDFSGAVRRRTIDAYRAEADPPERLTPDGPRIALPAPAPLPERPTLGEILIARRTVRGYRPGRVPVNVLSGILTHGLDDVRQRRVGRRLDQLDFLKTHGVPFDFSLVVYGVEGLEPGVYHYELVERQLVLQRRGTFRDRMRPILAGMKAPETAAWTLALSADFAQYQWRYRHERAMRNLWIAAGRIAQRVIVVGETYGLGTLPTPAMRDAAISELLALRPPRQSPVYTVTMGRIARGEHADA